MIITDVSKYTAVSNPDPARRSKKPGKNVTAVE